MAINGASGRMGGEIARVIKTTDEFLICGSLDEKITSEDFDTFTRIQELRERTPHAIIDYSSPQGTLKILAWCMENKKPIVIGTTGFKEKELKIIESASKKVPIFLSPNMSLGISALNEGIKAFLKAYGPCDISIEEIHHKTKKDKPSGTAFHLEEGIKANKKASQKIFPPVSLRGGEVYGIHKVYFFGTGEWISFEHHAQGRALFAEGTLAATKWIIGKKPGLYSMKDLIKG